MERIWETGNRKLTLDVSIKCPGTCRFIIYAEDPTKMNSKYVNRIIEVEGWRTVELKLPQTPQRLKIVVSQVDNNARIDYLVDVKERELVTYNIHLDTAIESFLKIAVPFCQISGYNVPPRGGRVFYDQTSTYHIKYLPKIVDQFTGQVLNTPARIGHRTGVIEISKAKYDTYTVAQRMIIILHEFSHKYRNPQIGLPISHESGADINALYIYLGLGYSKVDAITVFANVFLKAQSEGNIRRMRKIQEYISRFENQEYAHKN